MKIITIPYIILIANLLLFSANVVCAQSSMSNKAKQLITLMNKNHFSPKPVDDSFSTNLFTKIIDLLDENKLYLIESDIKQLLPFKKVLDDELNGVKTNQFYKVLKAVFKTAYKRTDNILNTLARQKFDFYVKDKIVLKQSTYSKNTAELQKKWQLFIKYNVLNTLYGRTSSGQKKISVLALTKMSSVAYASFIKKEKSNIESLLMFCDEESLDFESLYLNTIAECYDPHAAFFTRVQKQEFEGALNTEDELFGFTYAANNLGIDEEVYISGIMPGSSAWKSQALHINDHIIGLQFEGMDSLASDQINMVEIDAYLRTTSNKDLYVTIRKQDGSTNKVWIRKEKINNDENSIKSFILNGFKKIGYLSLPAFYTKIEDATGTNCASDMAKEILKLKAEKIEGIILDIRYNGGGSLSEAIEMVGIFINDGPIAMYKDGKGKITSLKDPHRGVVYDGPLVVLINGYSASASELLAGSFKALNRAVIIGSTSYGKGSSQSILALDTTLQAQQKKNTSAEQPSNEYVKLTVGNFFDVAGNSNQLTGVTPDVLLPDFTNLSTSEKELNYNTALPNTNIDKNKYANILPKLPINKLVLESNKRIQYNNTFNDIKNALKKEEANAQALLIPLDWVGFEQYMNALNNKDKLSVGKKKTNHFSVTNHAEDERRFAINEYAKKHNNASQERILLDAYIEESYLVMRDLINFLKNK
jgi:carboxyl-terminal processing protease